MTNSTSTPTTERRARPRGPGCSACASGQACPASQACEAPDPLDTTPATVGEQVHGLLLVALGAALCALFLIFAGPGV